MGRTLATEEWKNGSFVSLEQQEYDLVGNVTASIDGSGQRTLYTYDAIGQLTSVMTPNQQTSRYYYSQTGNLTRVTYPNTQTVTKQYDELGRLIKQMDPEGQSTTYFYDTRSNLVKTLNRLGKTTERTYNSESMLTGVKGPDTSVTYSYDDMGRRKSMIDDHGTTSYAYAAANGALESLTFPDSTRIDYENNTQQRIGYTLTDTTGASLRVRSELDTMNRVTSMDITAGSGGVATMAESASSPVDRMAFEYSANSMLERQSFGSGPSTDYQYDGYDLSGMSIEQGGSTTHQFGYNYDRNKNIITRSQNGAVDQYTYDPSNRIQSEAGTQNETYSYDANGNRLDKGSGKIFGLKNAEYTYDSQNRLKKVVGEGKTVSYTYNGDGLLYERTEGEQITRHYYDEEAKLIAEAKVSSSGKADISYMYIYDLYGQLWARQDKESGKLQYYQLNGHGDVVGMVDANGKTLNSYTYDIWGGPLIEEETVPNTLRYAGEYWDDTTGLQYLRARWYDPGTARFMGEDTYEGDLTNPLSLNLYTYVGNNPLIYVDPSGNVWKWVDNGWKMVKRGAKATANFLVLDDLRTLSDPNSSLFDKGMAVAGFIPIGKFAKGGKLVVKWSNKSGKVVEKAVKICNCFTAGTEVQTDEGEKNIEDIEVGDKVLSKDEETGEVAYKEVTATFNHETDEIYKIHVGDQTIESTFNHPFWVEGKGWTFVKDLQVGDLLVQSDGNTLKIDSIELERMQVTVYNLRVDDFHTYFVSGLGIWVHNTNCWGKFSSDDLKKLAQADQKDIKRITGNSNDAFGFFKEQVSSYKEASTGVFVGKDSNGVTFTYRAFSKSGPPTIDVNGISGVRKIKFLED